MLVLTSPLIALAMLAIRLESAGHPIYRQRRVGLDGRPFDVLKLRTMVDGAEHIGAGLAVNENDSRITRVGALLRRTSLDELPNLLNVLRGEMSLIGPRPTLPVQVEQYTERQRGRLLIKPGITGWAQVNGRTSLPWSERIELDLFYIEHRSLAARPARSCGARSRSCSAATGSTRARPVAGRASCDEWPIPPWLSPPAAGDPADRGGQALRHRRLLRFVSPRRSSPTHRRWRRRSTPRRCVPRSR